VRLIVQPDDGVLPVVLAIRRARKTVEMPIFRLDHVDVDRAIKAAVKRGVSVRTLIAHTNAGGEKALRKLEQRLLATGATVSRTDDDLVRYHNKVIIVDRDILYVLGFNYTHLDIDMSRSFGVATRNRKLVAEAVRLFEADFDRQPYSPGHKSLVVSPMNARQRLSMLLRGARRQLLIYDPSVSDNAMIKILHDRARAGVEVRIIGKMAKRGRRIKVQKLPGKRLHVRAIVQDGRRAFVGSQSLRRLELEGRREVGLVFADAAVVKEMVRVFEEDWAQTSLGKKQARKAAKETKKAEEKAEKERKRERARDDAA
jgi:phosphatidylserine/phosphatidylglycerophosphate/cardiolipin synthase-like enzyme